MEDARELTAFRQMRADVQAEYDAAVQTMADLKAQGKAKTVTFRTAFAAKLTLGDLLDRYRRYGL